MYKPFVKVCKLSFQSLSPASYGVISLAWEAVRQGNHFIPNSSKPSVNGTTDVTLPRGTTLNIRPENKYIWHH